MDNDELDPVDGPWLCAVPLMTIRVDIGRQRVVLQNFEHELLQWNGIMPCRADCQPPAAMMMKD